jgi:hypothetical protein
MMERWTSVVWIDSGMERICTKSALEASRWLTPGTCYGVGNERREARRIAEERAAQFRRAGHGL